MGYVVVGGEMASRVENRRSNCSLPGLCPVFCVNDQALFLGLRLFLGMGCKGRGHFEVHPWAETQS